MATPDVLAVLAVEDAIKGCFEGIFKDVINELNIASEIWLQQSKLLTIGRNNYAKYIAHTVGTFPLFGTSRYATVSNVYVNVGITADIENERYKTPQDIEKMLREQKRGEVKALSGQQFSPLKALEETSDGFALLGNPGSGKSTAFRYIAVEAAKGSMIRGKKRIPFYLAVRDISLGRKKIQEAAIQILEWQEISNADKVLHSLLKSGNCIILVDGLDETESEFQRELVMELSELRAKYQKSVFCVSARKHSLSIGLSGYKKWETQSLSLPEREAFVQKWFYSVDEGKGNRLLEQSKDRPELLDLGSSPLLLSIVCALFNNDLDIPKDPDELYSRCTEGLLGAWDTFRNIARKTVLADFSIRKRIIIVSWIAAAMFEEGKIVFSVDDISLSKCLEKATEAMRQEPPPADELIKSLQNDFGILVERAPDLYSFSHLTLQEYLVALYVVDNRRELNLVTSHFHHRQWVEILCLVSKMLPNADEYIKAIHKKANFNSYNDAVLFTRIWNTKPILSSQVVRELMFQISSRIANTTKTVLKNYRIKDSVIYIDGRKTGGEFRKQITFISQRFKLYQINQQTTEPEKINDDFYDMSVDETPESNTTIKSQQDKHGSDKKMYTKELGWGYFNSVLSIPMYLDIIHSTKLTYKEIGCDKSPFFMALVRDGAKTIKDILIE